MRSIPRLLTRGIVVVSVVLSSVAVSTPAASAGVAQPTFTIDAAEPLEGVDPALQLTVSTDVPHAAFDVEYSTRQDPEAARPALAETDYAARQNVFVTFGADAGSVTLPVDIVDDTTPEFTETFLVDVFVHPDSDPESVLFSDTVSVSIFDDDSLTGYLNDKPLTSFEFSANGSYQPLAGNFDCTETGGYPGIFFYAPGRAPDFLWTELRFESDRFGHTSTPTSVSGVYQPFTGDFDSNGCSDIFWYAPGSGADYVWYSTPSGFESHRVNVSGNYQPIVLGEGLAIYWWNPVGRDFFWLPEGMTFESISTLAQFDGLYYRPFSMVNPELQTISIVWYIPGGGPDDIVWNLTPDGFEAFFADDLGALDIVATPIPLWAETVLHRPGRLNDPRVQLTDVTTFASTPMSVSGAYRTSGTGHPFWETIVWHAPGSAKDYLWISEGYFADGWYDEAQGGHTVAKATVGERDPRASLDLTEAWLRSA